MGSLVACLADEMESRCHVRGQHTAPLQDVNTLHGIAALGQGDVVHHKHGLDHTLAQKAQLHQAGLRVSAAIPLSQDAKLFQRGELLVQEGEI